MQALGIDVLFKGINMQRLLGGLWISLRISLIAVAFSIVLGLIVGVLMAGDNPVIKAVTRVYLEIVRVMPPPFHSLFRDDPGVRLEHRGRDRLYYSVYLLGNGGDGGPCARRADQHSEAPV